MPIITKAQTKKILFGTTSSTTYDAEIDNLIPLVQDDVVEMTNNEFFMRKAATYGSGISFTAGTTSAAPYISDSNWYPADGCKDDMAPHRPRKGRRRTERVA